MLKVCSSLFEDIAVMLIVGVRHRIEGSGGWLVVVKVMQGEVERELGRLTALSSDVMS